LQKNLELAEIFVCPKFAYPKVLLFF